MFAWSTVIICTGTGVIAGLFSGMLGIGGGAVMVPMLILGLHLPPQVAIGTSLLAIVPAALFGGWRHVVLGHVAWAPALVIGVCAALAALLGAQITSHLSPLTLQRIFALLLLFVALRLLWPSE